MNTRKKSGFKFVRKLLLIAITSVLGLTSCVNDYLYEFYDEIDDLNEMMLPRKKNKMDVPPPDNTTWQNGECATWVLLFHYHSTQLSSQYWKDKVINALFGINPSLPVSSETRAQYNAAIQSPSGPGGFTKSQIINAASLLGMAFTESSIEGLGIDRYNKNKSLSGVIMSTGNHVVIADRYVKNSDSFEIRDVFTYMGYDAYLENQNIDDAGLGNSRTVSANSVVWIIRCN